MNILINDKVHLLDLLHNLENVVQSTELLLEYDKEKYREMILDATESVLGIFGFDRTVYDGNFEKTKKGRKGRVASSLREERIKDIQTEMSE